VSNCRRVTETSTLAIGCVPREYGFSVKRKSTREYLVVLSQWQDWRVENIGDDFNDMGLIRDEQGEGGGGRAGEAVGRAGSHMDDR
jgi:hypothetical protein